MLLDERVINISSPPSTSLPGDVIQNSSKHHSNSNSLGFEKQIEFFSDKFAHPAFTPRLMRGISESLDEESLQKRVDVEVHKRSLRLLK